jgi:DMSO/TMAO reductase YedYZ molybdopterin-dependent catalytic subunit
MERIAPRPRLLSERKPIFTISPHRLTDCWTPTDLVFGTSSLGIAEVDVTNRKLEITGLVDTPLSLSYDDLKNLPKRSVESVFVCSGNPHMPTRPTRKAANVRWAGADLAELLNQAGIDPTATHLWSYGLDFGEVEDYGEIPHYVKDMPLSRLEESNVLIAYELNGEPLSVKNGFPARLLIPGYYGTNNTKWLCRLELADRRADSYQTTVLYNDPDYDTDPSGKVTKPVWAVAPQCMFASHKQKNDIPNEPTELWGWAWSSGPVEWVEVSTDGGDSWQRAELEPAEGGTWQRFSLSWRPPGPGEYDIRCRTQDVNGQSQPPDNARNAIQSILMFVEN